MADTEQIVIEFIADTSQIQGVIPTLQKIGNLSKADADALLKLSNKTSAASRESADSGQKMSKVFGDLEKKAKSLSNTLEKSFKTGVADALAEAGVAAEDFEAALSSAGLSMNDVHEASAKLASESDNLRKELKATTDAMAALVKIGQRNSAEYEELSIKAGELKKSIADANKDIKAFGSDTRGLDKVLMGARGIAGAFAVAQGAAALLGDENEELQKTLLKVNAAMSVLQGLKELQELANTREFASLTALVGAKKLDVLQTSLQTGAESKNIVVRYAAVAAQKALNVVMSLSPIGLLIAGISAIALAYKLFASSAKEATDAQHRLNLQFDEQLKWNDQLIDAIRKGGEGRVAQMRANNAAESAVRDEELRNLKEQQTQISAVEQARVSAFEDANARLRDTRTKYSEEQIKEDAKTVESFNRIQEQRYDIERQIELKIIENEEASRKERLRNASAFADAMVLAQKEGSRKELVAQIAAIRAREQEELNSAARLPGEIAKIRAQAQKEIDATRNEIKLFDLNEELAVINAKIALSKKGSAEEFQLQLDAIKKQNEIELANKALTDNQRYQLETEYIRKVEDLQKDYNRKTQEEAINTKMSEINASLANLNRASVSENNAELLRLKKELIDQQTAMDIIAAQDSITNAEQLAAKLKDIWAQNAAAKAAIDEQEKAREIKYSLDITNLAIENAKKRAQIDMSGGDLKQRIAARKEYQRLVIQQINEEEAANDKMWEEGLITYEEYNRKLLEIQGKRIDSELAAEQEKENRKAELISAGFNVLQTGMDTVFQINANRRQADFDDIINKLQKQYDAEINMKGLTEEQKAAIDERYRRREAQLKRAAYIKDKNARVSQAVMNGLLAVTNALATVQPFYAALVAAGTAAVTTTLNVAKIKSEPIPQFKKGTRSAPKGYAWVGEEGPELVHLRGGEKIWTYKQSEKIHEAWRGGSMASADKILSASVPVVEHELMNGYSSGKSGAVSFDYEKMGKSVAAHLPKQAVLQNNMDENGFTTFILENGNRTQIRNRRYSFN